jgi:hypothetical protein
VRRREAKGKEANAGPWVLHAADGSVNEFTDIAEFSGTLKTELSAAPDIEKLFDLWERNVATVRMLTRCGRKGHDGAGLAKALVEHFKDCARSHAKSPEASAIASGGPHPAKIDKSVLTIGEPKRVRSKEHLRYVTSQRV